MFGGQIGTGELVLILVVLLLLFGARKLPDLARSIGQSAKEFRKGVSEGASDEDEAEEDAAEEVEASPDQPDS